MAETLILCATSRLAQTLRAKAPAEAAAWRAPAALTPGQWLGQLAEEAQLLGLAELPQALDAFSEKLLWEQSILACASSEEALLFDLPGMAASAAEAHALLRLWPLDLRRLSDASPESARFLLWQREFLKRCRQGNWMDLNGFLFQVIELLASGKMPLPASVEFAGFDRFSPLESRLSACLENAGVSVQIRPPGPVDRSQAVVLSCADQDAECLAVAHWLSATLEKQPASRLAVVAPDLQRIRERLEFLLEDLLVPQLMRPEAVEWPRPYNFSLGRPLADLPLIAAGLDWLAIGLGRGKSEQSRLSQLLLSPYWAASLAEADDLARLDALMRRELPYFTRFSAVLRLAQRLAGKGRVLCPRSMQQLAAWLDNEAAMPARRQLPSAWIGIFSRLLEQIGWPGERSLSSHEYQAHRAFLAELAAFGRLDKVLGPLSSGEAVRRLRQACRARLFQPETRGEPAIQILGVLESAGLEFDALWVMGMSDDVWPPAPRPNPLLPADWLRQVGASHASAEVELDFARRVHARLLASAPEVIFSSAALSANRLLRPSPLLAGLPVLDRLPPVRPRLASLMAANAGSHCEAIDDAFAPPVAEGERVAGGSWLLRAQAICPAWGFYQYRLAANAIEVPVEGLDPRDRGTLVHAALERFWRQTPDSAGLATLLAADLAEAIAAAVAQALDNFESERHLSLPSRFRQLEAQRLQRLLGVWLPLEAAREQGFTVVACEAPVEIDIEHIRVRMVVDRIDRLQDGEYVIIDYKTGATIDVSNWSQDRLSEPQLPIYAALAAVDRVEGVVFAKVLLDKPAFSGIASSAGLLPGVQGLQDEKQKIFPAARFPDWDSVLEHWRQALRNVALEVRAGDAGVRFAEAKDLQYCEVKPLLRLAERAQQLARWQAQQES